MSGASERMVQGLVAVVPPSASIPEYALSTGEKCQAVGVQRNADGLWISAYIYALAPASQSMPDDPGALRVDYAGVDDTDPAAAGSFPVAPQLSFSVELANEGTTFVCDTQVRRLEELEWTGPAGRWPQVGPEIVSERVYRMRPQDPGAAGSQATLQSGDACGMLEICETRIAGDDDVILYRGRWINAAYRAQDDPFTPSDYVDGEVFLKRLGVSAELGWTLRIWDEHPSQTTGFGASVDLLVDRGEDEFFPTCSRHSFTFTARRSSAGSDANDRSRDYTRCKHVAHAVGGLGPTRQPIWGTAQDHAIDWGRLGLRDQAPFSSAVGWDTIRVLGEAWGNGEQGEPGFRLRWINGADSTDSTGGRVGWFQAGQSTNGNASGTSGRFASTGHVPWWGGWLRARYLHEHMMSRCHLSIRDIETGEAAWWWEIAQFNGGEWRSPFVGSMFAKRGRRKLWVFNEQRLTQFDIGSSNFGQYRLAPTDRPWNAQERPSSNQSNVLAFETLHCTHTAPLRGGITDLWWGCRDFVAYRDLEELAASFSRVFVPVDPYAQPGNFEESRSATQWILDQQSPAFYQSGQWAINGFTIGEGAVRGWAWPYHYLCGLYGIAHDELRASMRGAGAAAAKGGADLLGSFHDLLEFATMPAGVVMRARGEVSDPSPDYWDENQFGPPNLAERRGALPEDNDGLGVSAAGVLHFQQTYMILAMAVGNRNVFGGTGDPRQGKLDRAFRYHDNYIQGSRIFGPGGGPTSMPYALLNSLGPRTNGDPSTNTPPDVPTVEEVRSGACAWQSIRSAFGGTVDFGYSPHRNKSALMAVIAARELGDDFFLYTVADVWERELDAEGIVEFFTRFDGAINAYNDTGIESEMTSVSGGRRYLTYTNGWLWRAPLVAYLLNQIT
ncbi:MAG: hypothetical protein AAGB93_00525 [Planctomycetota bacterium]